MNISRLFILAASVVTLFCVVGGWFFFQEQQRIAEQAALKAELDKNKALYRAKMADDRLRKSQQRAMRFSSMITPDKVRPFSDYAINYLIPGTYNKPTSEWHKAEKAFYQKIISSEQYDLMVVPFQVQEYALDRPTRSLMTAEVVMYLKQAKKIKIPDPYLLARALGDGDRRLDNDEVYALAQKLGVKTIVWGYVGHDRKNHMGLTLQIQDQVNNIPITAHTKFITKNLENIDFSDEIPPIEVIQAKIPEILTQLGANHAPDALSEGKITLSELPEKPFDLVKESNNPAQDALNFQLLAYLTPHVAERSKERFAEKSYLALLKLSPNTAEYRELKARTLLLLGLRPAALKVLGDPQTTEEKELIAVLNGHLPDTEKYSSQIKPTIKKLLAKLDQYEINAAYTGIRKIESLKFANNIKLPGVFWPFTVNRALTERDEWAQFDNLSTKLMLDSLFPIKDFSAENLLRGATTLGDTTKINSLAELSPFNHVRKLIELEPSRWCCQADIDYLAEYDFLSLLEAIAEDNLLRRASFYTYIQGAPESTIDFLREIENSYKGHPRFTMELAKAQTKHARSLQGSEKEGMLSSAYANTFNAWYWEQGQTLVSADAYDLKRDTGREDYGYHDNLFASDYPFRPFYEVWEDGGNTDFIEANAEAALRNSTLTLKPFNTLNWHHTNITRRADKYDTLLKSIQGRFIGEPAIYQILARNSLNQGDFTTAELNYREAIKAQPNVWQSYMDLGTLLFEQGKTQEAYKFFMAYPEFKKGSEDNPVGLSNTAYEAGSKFYWLGEFTLAKSLYKIASKKPTGSRSDITSQLRLNLMDGDMHSALTGSLESGRRYNDTYGFRNYLGLLHAMGESQAAWDSFNALAGQSNASHIWETVLVGHRKEKKSEEEIIQWVKDRLKQNIGHTNDHAAKYLLRAGIVDRTPSIMFAKAISDVSQPILIKNGFPVKLFADGLQHIVGPSISDHKAPETHQLKSDLTYFAEAYQLIRFGNFNAANTLLQEASALFYLNDNDQAYVLPYYALAAAKTGNAAKVKKYLANFKPEDKRFDFHLAEGVLAAIAGNTKESVEKIKIALYKRPFTEERPLQTEFQYAEICKLLFEITGKSEYKAIALDWAKKNQVFQPWFSWAYAMEAMYTNKASDKKRAIAMAHYLDPQSEMLKKIPNKERESVIKQHKSLNIFLKQQKHKTESAI